MDRSSPIGMVWCFLCSVALGLVLLVLTPHERNYTADSDPLPRRRRRRDC
jgi:hypothetical protein